jgi:hypothetical protein
MATSMLEDHRTISRICFAEGECYTVRRFGITRIEAYQEPGQSAYVPWFAVYKENEIAYRVNGALVAIVRYEPDAYDDQEVR